MSNHCIHFSITGSFTVKLLLPNPLFWWDLLVPLKIKIFMWLLSSNKILTKYRLIKKRVARRYHLPAMYQYRNQRSFVPPMSNNSTGLVWFGSGQIKIKITCLIGPLVRIYIVNFALTLQHTDITAFFTNNLIYSALCWTYIMEV